MLKKNKICIIFGAFLVFTFGCGKSDKPRGFQPGFFAAESGEKEIIPLIGVAGDEFEPKIYSFMAKECGDGQPHVEVSTRDRGFFDNKVNRDRPIFGLHGVDKGCKDSFFSDNREKYKFFAFFQHSESPFGINVSFRFNDPKKDGVKIRTAYFKPISKAEFLEKLKSDRSINFDRIYHSVDKANACLDLFQKNCEELFK